MGSSDLGKMETLADVIVQRDAAVARAERAEAALKLAPGERISEGVRSFYVERLNAMRVTLADALARAEQYEEALKQIVNEHCSPQAAAIAESALRESS